MSEPGHRPDVSALPTTAFGSRDFAWWGTVGFIVIEGLTLLICAVSYLYLRRYVGAWPPLRTPAPDLWPAILQGGLMLASWYPMSRLNHAAHRFDRDRVKRWMIVVSLFGVAFLVLRWFEFAALNVRWDTNAYASIAWLTVGFHATILVLEVVETICFAVVFHTVKPTERLYADTSDNATYWYFMTGSWILLAALVYFVPWAG